jgi:hypothetical protein
MRRAYDDLDRRTVLDLFGQEKKYIPLELTSRDSVFASVVPDPVVHADGRADDKAKWQGSYDRTVVLLSHKRCVVLLCSVCEEMESALISRPWFVEPHAEYLDQTIKRRAIFRWKIPVRSEGVRVYKSARRSWIADSELDGHLVMLQAATSAEPRGRFVADTGSTELLGTSPLLPDNSRYTILRSVANP